jgi:hypothetical protein
MGSQFHVIDQHDELHFIGHPIAGKVTVVAHPSHQSLQRTDHLNQHSTLIAMP